MLMADQPDSRERLTSPLDIQNEPVRAIPRILKSLLSHLGIPLVLAWFIFVILGFSVPVYFVYPALAKFFKFGGGHIIPGITGNLVMVLFLMGALSIFAPIVWRSRHAYLAMFLPLISVIGIWIIYFRERYLIVTHLQHGTHDAVVVAKLLCIAVPYVATT